MKNHGTTLLVAYEAMRWDLGTAGPTHACTPLSRSAAVGTDGERIGAAEADDGAEHEQQAER